MSWHLLEIENLKNSESWDEETWERVVDKAEATLKANPDKNYFLQLGIPFVESLQAKLTARGCSVQVLELRGMSVTLNSPDSDDLEKIADTIDGVFKAGNPDQVHRLNNASVHHVKLCDILLMKGHRIELDERPLIELI